MKLSHHVVDLFLIYSSALDGQRARGVDPKHGEFVVVKLRSEIVGDISFEFRKRIEEATEDIVKRHVVIAWHDELRTWQAIEKCTSLAELFRLCALRQIA